MKLQKQTLLYLIKNIGLNILQGKLFTGIQLPVYIFEKKSLLERITDYDEREKKLLESVQEEFGDGRLDLSSYEFVKSE